MRVFDNESLNVCAYTWRHCLFYGVPSVPQNNEMQYTCTGIVAFFFENLLDNFNYIAYSSSSTLLMVSSTCSFSKGL